MTRRTLFATLTAPFIAPLEPKPKLKAPFYNPAVLGAITKQAFRFREFSAINLTHIEVGRGKKIQCFRFRGRPLFHGF